MFMILLRDTFPVAPGDLRADAAVPFFRAVRVRRLQKIFNHQMENPRKFTLAGVFALWVQTGLDGLGCAEGLNLLLCGQGGLCAHPGAGQGARSACIFDGGQDVAVHIHIGLGQNAVKASPAAVGSTVLTL